jgi:hypothetical protein
MKAKLVLHHDDSCTARLEQGFCFKCGFVPDMQSTCFYYYCPVCDQLLEQMCCPKCGQTFEDPEASPTAVERARLLELRLQAWNKLTPEEREALGIKVKPF